jgi:hypothetical protein
MRSILERILAIGDVLGHHAQERKRGSGAFSMTLGGSP